MKFLLSLIIAFSLLFSGSDLDLPGYAKRKMNKAIQKTWPGKEITKKKVVLPAGVSLSVKKADYRLFTLLAENHSIGYLCVTKAPSKFDDFDYMVIFDTEMKILKVRVLVYRENYGGEISSKRWLKQFVGKSQGKGMEINDDVQAISGATISVRSLTHSLKKLSKDMTELRKKKVLD